MGGVQTPRGVPGIATKNALAGPNASPFRRPLHRRYSQPEQPLSALIRSCRQQCSPLRATGG